MLPVVQLTGFNWQGFNWQVFPLERHILFYLLTSGTAHCANMYPSSDDDTAELKEARTKINNLVGQWLKQDWISQKLRYS